MRNAWRRGTVAGGCALSVVLASALALAERVVLVRPTEEATQLAEIYVRLQGELRMHGFDAMLASSPTKVTFVEMQRLATLAQAEACVAFDVSDGQPTVYLWFVDRLTDSPRTFTFSGCGRREFGNGSASTHGRVAS